MLHLPLSLCKTLKCLSRPAPLASPNLQLPFDPATSTCLALSDHSPPAPWPRTSPRLDTISLHHLYLSPTATGSYAATIRSSHHHDEPPPAFRSDYHPFQAPLSHPKIHSNPRNVTGRRVNHGPSPPLLHSHQTHNATAPPSVSVRDRLCCCCFGVSMVDQFAPNPIIHPS
ncbi:hypothetical protein L2E82_46005 [Cichorium intybus]|uniref:Uncharacterized protein n=1 Tax=Cichorium intybus TaxID=13427 RepID=A0ACB8ZVK0_CICIN|nr:hypothetical protein L2E82_46005 [Cichorium intybus]